MKNVNKLFLTILTLVSILILDLASCSKDVVENETTLEQIYKTYKNGEIDECKYNGQTVYKASLNAFDAGSLIYDKDMNQIGTCNYAFGQVDSICNQLTNCITIYRIEDNFWGLPAVNKYGLGN